MLTRKNEKIIMLSTPSVLSSYVIFYNNNEYNDVIVNITIAILNNLHNFYSGDTSHIDYIVNSLVSNEYSLQVNTDNMINIIHDMLVKVSSILLEELLQYQIIWSSMLSVREINESVLIISYI